MVQSFMKYHFSKDGVVKCASYIHTYIHTYKPEFVSCSHQNFYRSSESGKTADLPGTMHVSEFL